MQINQNLVLQNYSNSFGLRIAITFIISLHCCYLSSQQFQRVYFEEFSNFIHVEPHWGDFDNDGDYDVLLDNPSQILWNEGVDFIAELLGYGYGNGSSVKTGDFNNDNALDLLFIARNQVFILQNDGYGKFSEFQAISDFADINDNYYDKNKGIWSDYDSDGDLDICLSGLFEVDELRTVFYQNTGSGFEIDEKYTIYGVAGSISEFDYENDGDIDYFINGTDIDESFISKIYLNDYPSEIFQSVEVPFQHVLGEVEWMDFNNDGDEDFFLAKKESVGTESNQSNLYVSKELGFNALDLDLGQHFYTEGKWGDFNVDGLADLLFFSGNRQDGDSRMIINQGLGQFVIRKGISINYDAVEIACSDHDLDGDLDLFLIGRARKSDGTYQWYMELHHNEIEIENRPPSKPKNLGTVREGREIHLHWNPSIDDHTHSLGLSYNILVGTTQGGIEIVSPMADISSGFRRIPEIGNAFFDTCWVLKNLEPGKYYWQVQAIDNSFSGSQFSDIDSFIVYQDFIETFTIDSVVSKSDIACFDFDNDEDLDVVLTGEKFLDDNEYIYETVILRNDGDAGFKVVQRLDSLGKCSIALGDYDNDGDADLLLSGYKYNHPTYWSEPHDYSPFISLFKNTNGSFNEVELDTDFEGHYIWEPDYNSCDWGDFDNDGDLDFLVSYFQNTQVFRNDGADKFYLIHDFLAGGIGAWADLDNDYDLDIICKNGIYVNDGEGQFRFMKGLAEIALSSVNMATEVFDHNNDTRLDVLVSFRDLDHTQRKTILFENRSIDSISLEQVESGLRAIYWWGSIEVGDFNNDNVSDLLFSRELNNPNKISLYQSDASSNFISYGLRIDNPSDLWGAPKFSWGDLNGDSNLDLAVTAYDYEPSGGNAILRIFENTGGFNHLPPPSPDSLTAVPKGYSVIFNWNQSFVNRSASPASYSYNMRIGTSPGGIEVVSPMANPQTGYLRVPEMGNCQMNTGWKIDGLPVGKYYWSVQAIDHSYCGGQWAKEQSFEILEIQVEFEASNVCQEEAVQFNDQSLVRGEPVDSWSWDFGDGVSSVQNPQYVFQAAGLHDVTLTVTRGAEDFQVTKHVLVKAAPEVQFIADEVCQGELTTLTNQSIENNLEITSWSWDFDDGITSANRDPQPHGFVNPGTYNVSLTAAAENGCSDTVQKVVSVLSKPNAQITEEGTMCVDPGYQLKTIEAPGYTYQWKYAGTDLIGASEASYSPDLPGNYSVVLNSQCGEVSASYTVEKPELSIVESGSACKDSDFTLATQQYASYTYQWKYQGIDIPDATQSSYQPTNAGEYTVEVQTPCGEVSASLTIEAPSYYIITEGIPCKGSNFVLKTEDWAANSYQWKYQGVSIEGATKAIHYPTRPGDYSVDIQTPCGLYSADYNVAFITGPAKPEVFIRGPEVWYLACSNDSADEYQWYRDGNLIEGASDAVYIPDQQLGMYQVRISNGGECFTGSDPVYLPGSFTGIEEDPFAGLKIYPNPTPGVFSIEMDNPIMGDLLIDIFTEQGSKVINIKFLKETSHFVAQVDLSAQSAGLYLIGLQIDKFKAERKLIVE